MVSGRVVATVTNSELPTTGYFRCHSLPFIGLVDNFKIGNGRFAARAPVDDILPAIDQSLFIQPDEDLHDGTRQPVVHRKSFPAPVAGYTHATHLIENRSPACLFPFPGEFQEFFPPQIKTVFLSLCPAVCPGHNVRRCWHDRFPAATGC